MSSQAPTQAKESKDTPNTGGATEASGQGSTAAAGETNKTAPAKPSPSIPNPLENLAQFLPRFLKYALIAALALPALAAITTGLHHQKDLALQLLLIGLCALFGGLSVIFLIRMVNALEKEPISVNSNWGGLGGGLGGWQVSRTFVYLLCAVTFGSLLAVFAASFPREEEEKVTDTKGATDAKESGAADSKAEPKVDANRGNAAKKDESGAKNEAAPAKDTPSDAAPGPVDSGSEKSDSPKK